MRRLPQLPPHLRDLRGQARRGKRSSHEPDKGPCRGHPELLASYDIKASSAFCKEGTQIQEVT